MVRRYRSGWWLERKYWDEGWTQAEIAEECGVAVQTIRRWMRRRGVETRELTGEDHPQYGTERSAETRAKISSTMAGREVSEEHRRRIAEGLRGRTIPESVRERIAESLRGRERSRATREKMSESTAGVRNPNWRGGYSRRYGSGWSVARRLVRNRDETCRACGHDGSERRLEVHHIVPVRRFRETDEASLADAHDPRNLVLLCRQCHRKADHSKLGFDGGVDLPE